MGFSVVKLILVIVILAGVGVGGYFAYGKFIVPMLNPYAKLIPEGLQKYAVGKNADAFIFYRKDQELQNNLMKLPAEVVMVNQVKSGLVMIQGSSQSVVAYVEFDNAGNAGQAKSLIDENIKKSGAVVPVEYSVNLENTVLILTAGLGKTAFNGALMDNPNMLKIDKDLMDSQLIFYSNNANLPQVSALMGTLPIGNMGPISSNNVLNVAHAQGTGFLSNTDNSGRIATAVGGEVDSQNVLTSPFGVTNFLKDSIFYLRLKNGTVDAKWRFNFLAKNELDSSSLLKVFTAKMTQKDLQKSYDTAMKQFKTSVPDLNRGTGLLKMMVPSMDGKIALNDLVLSADVQAPLQDIVDLAVKQDVMGSMINGPVRARDAARKANLNSIYAALEQYNATDGEYPQNSACIDQIKDLNVYFKSSKAPVDPKGQQNFGSINCEGGFYYQYIPKSSFILWAKMELANDGNMGVSPDEYLKNPVSTKSGAGIYFAVGDGLFYYLKSTNSAQPVVVDTQIQPKVKRIKANEQL